MRNVGDLTGTKITASQNIVVLSGTEWTPMSTEPLTLIGSYIIMQLTPVDMWGQLFVTSSLVTTPHSMRILGQNFNFIYLVYERNFNACYYTEIPARVIK